MVYTAFKQGDKVNWDGIKAVVVDDSSARNQKVKVKIDITGVVEYWYKIFGDIPVALEP